MDLLQDYPTSPALALRAWAKFKNKTVTKLLEPHAGNGDLVQPWLADRGHYPSWDAIEINARKHPELKAQNAAIVGYDFLSFGACALYSHIIMNPPFRNGVQHVLHAWNGLFEGEIVAIINAETIRNPFSAERQHLTRLIDAHGSVEFIQDAFLGPDVTRETAVEIALVHLEKKAPVKSILGSLLSTLAPDQAQNAETVEVSAGTALAIPEGFIERTVRDFEEAASLAKEAACLMAKAQFASNRLGETMSQTLERMTGGEAPTKDFAPQVRDTFATEYAKLKDRAWTRVLMSTQVAEKLSSTTYKNVLAEFGSIKLLEFTVANIYGFLEGLCQASGDIQADMVCGVFDKISAYHTENTVYYMGWKSNDAHRTMGMRVKKSRFIIPDHKSESYYKRADHHCVLMLRDFDKAFALLEGKTAPDVSLASLFDTTQTFKRLCAGERLSSDYFDVRYYPKRGTIHFFPRNAELMDKLNRMVGKYRQWLPPRDEDATPDFHTQYNEAEKLHEDLMVAFEGAQKHHRDARLCDLRSRHDEFREPAHQALWEAAEAVMLERGLAPFARLGAAQSARLLEA